MKMPIHEDAGFGFLARLPPELRDCIYEAVSSDLAPAMSSTCLPRELCLTSRTIYFDMIKRFAKSKKCTHSALSLTVDSRHDVDNSHAMIYKKIVKARSSLPLHNYDAVRSVHLSIRNSDESVPVLRYHISSTPSYRYHGQDELRVHYHGHEHQILYERRETSTRSFTVASAIMLAVHDIFFRCPSPNPAHIMRSLLYEAQCLDLERFLCPFATSANIEQARPVTAQTEGRFSAECLPGDCKTLSLPIRFRFIREGRLSIGSVMRAAAF
jgi:hypothetical protein